VEEDEMGEALQNMGVVAATNADGSASPAADSGIAEASCVSSRGGNHFEMLQNEKPPRNLRNAGGDLIPGSVRRRPPGSEGRKEQIT
jgi:hypothetical protein